MIILISIALFLIAINTTLNCIDNRKIKKQIKGIADKQFDAQQVINLYAMKYAPKPMIITEQKNVTDLFAELNVPCDMQKFISDRVIKERLLKDITKEIEPYVEMISDTDIPSMEIRYRARLQVINRIKEV